MNFCSSCATIEQDIRSAQLMPRMTRGRVGANAVIYSPVVLVLAQLGTTQKHLYSSISFSDSDPTNMHHEHASFSRELKLRFCKR